MSILNPIFKVFGQFLMWLYTATGSYVLALVIFTLLIKLVLFPFSIKSKRSMMKTQALQSRMQQLQKQYGKDKEKYNQAVTELYTEEGVNPMGGCLWSLLPLPILWGVYAIVRRPLAFMYALTTDQISDVKAAVEGVVGELSSSTVYAEVQVANLLHTNSDALEAAKSALGDAASKIGTTIDYSFAGINLSQTPQLKFWTNGLSWGSIGLFLLPVIMAVVAFVSSSVSQKTNKINQDEKANSAMDANARSMLLMMPLMYVWFGFIMPASMCIYMLISCLLQMVQEVLASKMLRSKFMEAAAAKEEAERQRKLEERRARQEKIEARQRAEEEARKQRRKIATQKRDETAPKTDKGAIGIRRYALGRNYEPDRYGGVTPYRNPNDIVDEAALEAALAAKKKKK